MAKIRRRELFLIIINVKEIVKREKFTTFVSSMPLYGTMIAFDRVYGRQLHVPYILYIEP